MTNGNAGCGVLAEKESSYGSSFNSASEGWYATKRTPTFIKARFWARDNPSIPAEVQSPTQAAVNTDLWGVPSAYFPNTECDIASKFGEHNVMSVLCS
ncbi:hypothetical protein FRC14_005783 [Serendipita sp. 396]|nr:hypothetical protein FRC14_005783 [Serendipita sp. 396]KAG8787102.1 hypothetical protein FRC15_009944 [Serendipita sp. 397]KAG8838775.1 hypothetical protein FRC18_002841 [Serendipita sp. 400]KAG8859496.1 hypothetical protein FRB91_007682 [Serendipita sp. 411]KAG8872283.1 hypothetical protein FRC20_009585 [Serendipita sp. 405]